MTRLGLAALLMFSAVAHAQEPDDSEPSMVGPQMTPNRAEYVRLAQELEKLAARNAWVGVERTLLAMEVTGVPLDFASLLAGAHAARDKGDAAAVRARLERASKIKEQKDVLEWMWEMDTYYGKVFLTCDDVKKQSKRATLETSAMPFDPSQANAVRFAINVVDETCFFEGLLPGGDYRFGVQEFTVKPRLETVRLDLRTTVK
ncbi:MAG: hypothetical protein GWP91_15575 [Rhodobacterales bacterium]|nr:hypothetical protein [Rhodobacterales bacterium]